MYNQSFVFWGSWVGDQNLKLRVLEETCSFLQSCHLEDECHFLPSSNHGFKSILPYIYIYMKSKVISQMFNIAYPPTSSRARAC